MSFYVNKDDGVEGDFKANEHRLWLDRVNAHGPELLDALKQLVVAADGMHYELRREFDHAQYVIDRAEALVAKLDGVSPLKSE